MAEIESPARWQAPIGRRLFLGLLGAGGLAFLGLGRLVAQPQHFKDVSTMPASGPDADLAAPRNVTFLGPERFRYYSVAPVPSFNHSTWRLSVGGLVDRPQAISYSELFGMSSVVVSSTFRCVTGWAVHGCRWQGVQLKRIFDLAGAQPAARHVSFLSFDGLYRESFTLDQASAEHAIVAYKLNGRLLAQEQGAPARVIQPEMFGYKNLKWLGGIKLTAEREQGYWERQGWCYPIIGDDSVTDCH
jgi:DMSO/TMAO reductase YedYZ molybdopterin-dependent catalytic subunit